MRSSYILWHASEVTVVYYPWEVENRDWMGKMVLEAGAAGLLLQADILICCPGACTTHPFLPLFSLFAHLRLSFGFPRFWLVHNPIQPL